jgi:hypothetical protein
MFAVAGMVYGWTSRGRVDRVYVWGGAILALSMPLRLALSGSAAWQAFARWLVA